MRIPFLPKSGNFNPLLVIIAAGGAVLIVGGIWRLLHPKGVPPPEVPTCRIDSSHNYLINVNGGSTNELLDYRVINYYNASNGRQNMRIGFQNDHIGNWVNAEKIEYTYTGNTIAAFKQYWQRATNSWGNYSKTDSVFGTNNKLSQFITQIWNRVSNVWENQIREEYKYNANASMTEEVYQIWEPATNSWGNYYKKGFSYNTAGLLVKDSMMDWNSSQNAWRAIPKSKVDYTYNTAGLLIEKREQTLGGGNNYNDYIKNTYTYNSDNLLIQDSGQRLISPSPNLVNEYKYNYTYNVNNCLEFIYLYKWDRVNINDWDIRNYLRIKNFFG